MSDVSATIPELGVPELLEPGVELTMETPLLELIDSMGILTLIGLIEDEFDIMIDPDELSAENLSSVRAVTDLVESKLR